MPAKDETLLGASGSILKAGTVTWKRAALSSVKKYLVLCAPLTVEDVHEVFTTVFKCDPASSNLDQRVVAWLGNIACSALRGIPLLILLSSEFSSSTPTFILFNDISAISNETQLRSACSFALHLDVKPYDMKFSAPSSTEYLEWDSALNKAMQIFTDRTVGLERNGQISRRILTSVFDFETVDEDVDMVGLEQEQQRLTHPSVDGSKFVEAQRGYSLNRMNTTGSASSSTIAQANSIRRGSDATISRPSSSKKTIPQ